MPLSWMYCVAQEPSPSTSGDTGIFMPQVIIAGSHGEGCDPQSPEGGTSVSFKIEQEKLDGLTTEDHHVCILEHSHPIMVPPLK